MITIKYFVRLNDNAYQSPFYVFSEYINGPALNNNINNLTLYKGVKYIFERSDSGHPFNIGDSWKSNNTGIPVESSSTNNNHLVNGIQSIVQAETLSFTLEDISVLNYFCYLHSTMIGNFNILENNMLPIDINHMVLQDDPVSIIDAINASKDCDDIVVEVNALITRLTDIRTLILAQKDYVETAIHIGAIENKENKMNELTIEPRVKKFKHNGKIRSKDESTGKMKNSDDESTEIATRYGGKKEKILKENQLARNVAEQTEGVSIEQLKKLIISFNALLVHSNDKSSTEYEQDFSEAIVPDLAEKETDDLNKQSGEFSNKYTPGGKHKFNDEMLFTLVGLDPNDTNTEIQVTSQQKINNFEDLFKPENTVEGSKRKFISKQTRGLGMNR